jgi:MoxR-like ATPase
MSQVRPLIEARGATLRIADVVLPRRAGSRVPGCPGPEAFRSFCLDTIVATTLRSVALAVRQRKPFCLRGPTGTSKTTLTRLLAMLLGRPVHSATLSSETRVADLAGRFVPRDPLGHLPLDRAELLAQPALLGERSRAILAELEREDRPPTRLEVAILRAEQSLPLQPLAWQDGVIPAAMSAGGVVVLNEANLAPTEVLERFNAVFEPRRPSLLLAEYDGRSLTPENGGVHADFLVCGTVNPTQYAGRRAFSTALADRFAFIEVEEPGEDEFRRLVRWAVSGESDPVTIDGTEWAIPDLGTPRHESLATIPGIVPAVDAVAQLHADLAEALRKTDRGQQLTASSTPAAFSRRLLVDFLDFAEAEHSARPIDSLQRLEEVLTGGVDFAYRRRGVQVLGEDGFEAALAAHGLALTHRLVIRSPEIRNLRRLRSVLTRRTGLRLDSDSRLRAQDGGWVLGALSGVVANWWAELFVPGCGVELRMEAV